MYWTGAARSVHGSEVKRSLFPGCADGLQRPLLRGPFWERLIFAGVPQLVQDDFQGADDFVLRRALLAERQPQVEGLALRFEAEDVRLRTPGLGLAGFLILAQLFARHPVLGNLLDERQH